MNEWGKRKEVLCVVGIDGPEAFEDVVNERIKEGYDILPESYQFRYEPRTIVCSILMRRRIPRTIGGH